MRATILAAFLATVATVSHVAAPRTISSDALDFTQQVIPVGKGPGFVAIGDMNHDGNADLLVANEDDGTISVLLGDGKGHFTPAPGSPVPCNKNPSDIAIADMNGDGNPDLVIANTQTPYITVLLGDGTGRFSQAPHSPFVTPSSPHPHAVAVGDFTGDGRPGVVTDSWGNGRILLIPSDGKGNLILPGKAFDTDGRYSDSGVRTGKLTRSGHLDIVTVGHEGNGVGLLLGDGAGGFRRASDSPFAAGANAWMFAVDDINRDGNLDVLTIPYEPDLRDPAQLGVTVLLGNGDAGFAPMRGSPLSLAGCRGPSRIAAGDLAGSGWRDIVVSCAQNDKLFFFLAGKDGSFAAFEYTVPTGWGGLAVGKLESAGGDSVVISNHKAGTITILRRK